VTTSPSEGFAICKHST